MIGATEFVERPVDLSAVPWSRSGSYMALSMNTQTRDHPGRDHAIEPGLYLCDVSGYRLWRWNGVFCVLGLTDAGVHQPEVVAATPTLLELAVDQGSIEVTFDGPDTMRLRCRGVGVRLVQSVLDPLDAALAFPIDEVAWRLQMGEDAHYVVTCLTGTLSVDAPSVRTGDADTRDRKVVDLHPDAHGHAELAITQYQTGYSAPAHWRAFDEAHADSRTSLAQWADRFPAVPEALMPTRDAALSLLWTNTVAPRGNLTRPAVLMSKNWMHAVWSWDNCFVALGLASGDPALAWDQFMLFFDRQAPDGMLADIVTDYGCIWGFCKPPVHGWTLRGLMRGGAVPEGGLQAVYPRLSAWTQWWLSYRDDDADGLAAYFHGCDSGQDNSTAFDETGFPATSPDLAAFLVVQMDVLADVALALGLNDEGDQWRRRADAHLNLLLDQLWAETTFVVRRTYDDRVSTAVHSQLFSLPLILGDRLPEKVRRAMLEQVGSIVTPYGVASESPASPNYSSDGYWRGPIWAPTTYLVIEGLRAAGDAGRADDLGQRFMSTACRSGFAENYEATSGEPLRDRGYSWSAAVFLSLAQHAFSLTSQGLRP